MSAGLKVFKFGSEVVCNELGLDQELLNRHAAGLVETYGSDGLVAVTSGAVMAGKAIVGGMTELQVQDFEDPTLAQIGNVAVMAGWQQAFRLQGVLAGEILTTHQEISDQREGPVLVETIDMAADRGVVSVVNNNDANSRDEIDSFHKGKDNDHMGLHIARAIGASMLGIFTRSGGVFDESGQLIDEINPDNYDEVIEMLVIREAARGEVSKNSKGGIASKVQVAAEAAKARIDSFIAAPNTDMTGDKVTRFVW